jgi:NAD(P)-dependent dehydrogenase (short-subunit alcohol dehydrogenase family)
VSEKRFEGKVAIVTGSGGGLGFEHARLLASRGASVVVNDLGGSVSGSGADGGAAKRAASEITSAGRRAVADSHSVSTPEGAAAVVQTALDSFGRVDILVNNAGILRDKSLTKLTPEDFDAVLAVHLRGSFLMTKAALEPMRAQGYGRIVNTSSPAGLYGNFGQTNYSSAKMGLIGLTRTTALEGARFGIQANAISPAAFTRMTESLISELPGGNGAEALSPAKVSPLVAWLCHEGCQLTGEVFGVGGGLVTRIFVAETPGIFEAVPTIESIAARMEEIRAEEGYIVPGNVGDSFAPILKRLA